MPLGSTARGSRLHGAVALLAIGICVVGAGYLIAADGRSSDHPPVEVPDTSAGAPTSDPPGPVLAGGAERSTSGASADASPNGGRDGASDRSAAGESASPRPGGPRFAPPVGPEAGRGYPSLATWARKNLIVHPYSVLEIPGQYPDGDFQVVARLVAAGEGRLDEEDRLCRLVRHSAESILVLLPSGRPAGDGELHVVVQLVEDGIVRDRFRLPLARHADVGPLNSLQEQHMARLLGWPGSTLARRVISDPDLTLDEARGLLADTGAMLRAQYAEEDARGAPDRAGRRAALHEIDAVVAETTRRIERRLR